MLCMIVEIHPEVCFSPLSVSVQTSKFTTDPGAIQKAADFVKAFMLGFDVEVILRKNSTVVIIVKFLRIHLHS